MKGKLCSYCQKPFDEFALTGRRKLEDGRLCEYRLCAHCHNLLLFHSPYHKPVARQTMWEVIWKQADEID